MQTFAQKKSFTLIELLIVLVVIGAIAAISVPAFTTIKERALVNEAVANLRLIAAAERIYATEIGGASFAGWTAAINDQLRLSLNNRNWEYRIDDVGGNPEDFQAHAVRTRGRFQNCDYAIERTMDEPVIVDGTCP